MKKSQYLLLALLFLSLNAFAGASIKFEINGLDALELKNAQGRLEAVKSGYAEASDEDKINQIQKKGPTEIQKALQPYGYYKSRVTGRLTHKNNQWTFIYNVKKGPALHITQLIIQVTGEGSDNKAIIQAEKTLPMKQGDVLQSLQYESSKNMLFEVSNNQGYIKSHFDKAEILIDLIKYQAKVTLQLNTGKRYYFGKTFFRKTDYANWFLNRFLSYREGEPFSNEKLINLQQDMSGSYYFDQVEVIPEIEKSAHNEVPVQINSTLPKSQRYSIGIGYGTFTGPRLTAGVSFRRTTNTGQHFDLNLQLSSVLSTFGAKYYIPGKNPITDRWVLGGSYQNFDPKSGNSESETFIFGYIRKIKNFQTSLSMNYLTERYTLFNEPNRTSHLLYPNLTVGYIKANDLINPSHGYSANVSLQGASDRLFSTTSFAQVDGKLKYLVSPFSFAKIIARGEIGYTVVRNLYELPLTMRFFAGGLTSIRGFPDSSIGPGKYLQIGSLEYQNKLYGDIYGAVFYDIGAASNHIGTPVNKGAGAGLVYYSIVGPIKIYLARALSKKSLPYSVEFSVGPEF